MIRKRLIDYLEYKEVTKYQFYKDVKISNGFLDKEGSIRSDICEKISYQYEDLNLDWLLTGRGKMIKKMKDVEMVNEAEGIYKTTAEKNAIPFVDGLAIGGFGGSNFAINERDVKDYYVIPKFAGRTVDFMIEVSGSSMYPKYNSGDIVACKIIKESNFIQWNKVHIIATEHQGILIKRLRQSDTDNCLLAISDNDSYEPFLLPENEISGLAIVVGVIRLE